MTVLMAEPEKALVDYLYFVNLKRKTLNERLTVRKLKKKPRWNTRSFSAEKA